MYTEDPSVALGNEMALVQPTEGETLGNWSRQHGILDSAVVTKLLKNNGTYMYARN